MFAMFAKLFSSLSMFIMAFENVGKIAVSVSQVGVEYAGAYENEARIRRETELHVLNKELKALK